MATHKKASSTLGPIGFKPYNIKKGEKYMNDGQLKHFRNILVLLKRQLMEEVDHTVQHMREDGADFYSDPIDRAEREAEFTRELRNRNREGKLLKKIEYSLERIDRGEGYGYCESCGAEIGIRRLEARPTAEMCIDCKTFDEIREKQTSGA
jgi:DnaK suppressor protein